MESKKEINVLVGANIKSERERAHLTQDELSEMIGIGTKSLSAIERGAVGVSISTLKRICQVLSISSDALLFGSVPKNDVQDITERLERLAPSHCRIVKEIFSKLLKAFALNEQ